MSIIWISILAPASLYRVCWFENQINIQYCVCRWSVKAIAAHILEAKLHSRGILLNKKNENFALEKVFLLVYYSNGMHQEHWLWHTYIYNNGISFWLSETILQLSIWWVSFSSLLMKLLFLRNTCQRPTCTEKHSNVLMCSV